jgi:hypothetical protein
MLTIVPLRIPTILTETAEIPEDGLRQAWRSVFSFLDGFAIDYHEVETTVHQWLDSALRHDEIMRDRVCGLFVTAATPAETALPPLTDGNAASAMIDMARRWAALDRADTTRADMAEGIRIALTFSWWTRLLRILIWNIRIFLRPRPAE